MFILTSNLTFILLAGIVAYIENLSESTVEMD